MHYDTILLSKLLNCNGIQVQSFKRLNIAITVKRLTIIE